MLQNSISFVTIVLRRTSSRPLLTRTGHCRTGPHREYGALRRVAGVQVVSYLDLISQTCVSRWWRLSCVRVTCAGETPAVRAQLRARTRAVDLLVGGCVSGRRRPRKCSSTRSDWWSLGELSAARPARRTPCCLSPGCSAQPCLSRNVQHTSTQTFVHLNAALR